MLMGLVFPTAGTARILGREWTDPESQGADRLSARAALFLRLPDRARIAGLLRTALGSSGERPQAPGREVLQRVGLTEVQGRAVAQVFQRHAAARGDCAGHSAQSQAGVFRRADVRAGSARPARSARPDGAAQAGRQDGIFLHPHSLRRRGAVRPRGHHPQRRVARRGRGGRSDLDAFRARWK